MDSHEQDEVDWSALATREARVRHFGEPHREEVLLRSDAKLAEHEVARARAQRAMADEAARQQTTLTPVYATEFAAERRRLASENPSIESLGEMPAVVVPAQPVLVEAAAVPPAEQAAAPAPPARAEPAPQKFVPSFMLTPAVSEPGAPSPAAAASVGPPAIVPSAPPPVEIRPAPSPAVDLDSTQPPLQRKGATLPFARDQDVPDAVRAAWAEARAEAERASEESERKKEAGERKVAGVDIDETAFLPRSAFTAAATPFEKKAGLENDEEQVRAAIATPELWIPLEEYAAFLAELAQDPTRAGFLRAKYGIAGEDAQRALGAGFAAIFARDASQRVRFDALIASERAKRAR